MQETVTNTNERKSLFSSLLDALEARDRQAQADRLLHEEKYMRRTQRIYDFHDRQRREAAELRRCLEYVSQHALMLESVLRGAGGAGGEVPLGGALVRQAAALQRCMAQCVANAASIRQLLTAAHQPQMDTMLAKMEAELRSWTAFLQRAADASYNTEVVVDNLHNMIAEQRRCVREVSSSRVFEAMCGAGEEAEEEEARAWSDDSPEPRARSAAACSTPIARD